MRSRHRVREAAVDRLLDDEARGGGAALAGREKGAVDRAFDRVLKIGVGEHDERILAAHFELEFAHRVGAGGRDRCPVATEPVKVIASTYLWSSIAWPTTEPRPMTRLNTPFGAPARTMISASACAEPGTRSAGLKTTRIAIGERGGDLPGGNREREIPRRDDADDAERLARHLDVDVRPNAGEFLAGDAQRFAGEEVEDLRRRGSLRRSPQAASCPLRARAGGRAPRGARGFRSRRAARMSWRSCGVCATRPGKAACAASIAASVWAASACAYSPTRSSVLDGLRLRE